MAKISLPFGLERNNGEAVTNASEIDFIVSEDETISLQEKLEDMASQIDQKQGGVDDIETIREGAAKGATSLQSAQLGVAGGVAQLNENGKIPTSQIPGAVDEVLEFPNYSSFPATGTSAVIYIDASTNKTYRWSGTRYVAIGTDLALGNTSSTAFAGDRGVSLEKAMVEAAKSIDELMTKVFPLTASYTSKNNSGTREVGTSVTPSAEFTITRQGKDVSASATVTAQGTTIAADKKSWTAPAISSGSVTYSTSVTQGGQTVNLGALTWAFSYYRYYGEVDSIPTDFVAAIKGLSKQLSTSSVIQSTKLNANKYYLFAVKGASVQFKVLHAEFNAPISGCITGTVTLEQENKVASNVYSYVLVPASTSSWNFKINC